MNFTTWKRPRYYTPFGLVVAACAALSCPTARAQEKADCAACHKTQAAQLKGSVHAADACTECHGGDTSYPLSADELQKLASQPEGSRGTFDHGSSFQGKPGRTKIPELCGDCHSNVERMNPLGLRTDQLNAYRTSGHGKALFGKGNEEVAVCVDCHGVHDIRSAHDPLSKVHPFNVPATCSHCHANKELMAKYNLPTEVTDEYRESVHGKLLLEQHDSMAPTCATCHGNHAAMPPGFRTVGAVCGKCHEHASRNFETSVHAQQPEHKGCVQCHGGGEGRHYHRIERITKPAGVLIQRYAHLMETEPLASPEEITGAIHPDPRMIMQGALPTCALCHEDPAEDKSLSKLFGLLDRIAEAERLYVKTAQRLDHVGRGVLLVDKQRFAFEDAKTHLIELAPLQHTLNNDLVANKVDELRTVCSQVNAQLDELEDGLSWRYLALWPIWQFAVLFSLVLYLKYKRLRRQYVVPLPHGTEGKSG